MSSQENDNNGDNDEIVDSDKEDSNNDNSSTSSSSSDEFESSDLDYEEKDKEYTNIIEDIEKQFTLLRQLYKCEKNYEIDTKIRQICEGKASEFTQPLNELISQNRVRLEIAKLIRDYRLNNLKQFYDAEKLAAEQNYKNEKELLKDSIRKDIEEKIQKLNEERYKADSEFFSVTINYMRKSNQRKYSYNNNNNDKNDDCTNNVNNNNNNSNNNCSSSVGGFSHETKRRKAIPISGPFIIHRLKEDEIKDDVNFIRCCLRSQKNNYFNMHSNNKNNYYHHNSNYY